MGGEQCQRKLLCDGAAMKKWLFLLLLFPLVLFARGSRGPGGRGSASSVSGGAPIYLGTATSLRLPTIAWSGADVDETWPPTTGTGDLVEQLSGTFTGGQSTGNLAPAALGAAQVNQAVAFTGACWATAVGNLPSDLPLVIREIRLGGADSPGQLFQAGNGVDGVFNGEAFGGYCQSQGFGPDGSFNATSTNLCRASDNWVLRDWVYDGGTTVTICTGGICEAFTVTDIGALGSDDFDFTLGGALACAFQPTGGFTLAWVGMFSGADAAWWTTAEHLVDAVELGIALGATAYPAPYVFSSNFENQSGYWCRGNGEGFRPDSPVSEPQGCSSNILDVGASQGVALDNYTTWSGDDGWWHVVMRETGTRLTAATNIEMFACPTSDPCDMQSNRLTAQCSFLISHEIRCYCNYPDLTAPTATDVLTIPVASGEWFALTYHYDFDTDALEVWLRDVNDATFLPIGARGTPDGTADCSSLAPRDRADGWGVHNFSGSGAERAQFRDLRICTAAAGCLPGE